MNTKKLSLLLVTGVAALTLTACKDSSNTDIVTMKGDTIKVTDFYAAAKTDPSKSSDNIVQQLILNKVFSKEFGKKVSDKDVQTELDKTKGQLGASYSSALTQAGLTEDSFKKQLRTQLLVKYAVDQKIEKTEYTDDNLKKTWETYHPDEKADIMSFTSKEDAQAALTTSKEDPGQFDSIAKEKQAEITFNSATDETKVPAKVKEAAYKLKKDEVSDVIENQDATTGQTTYYIVKMLEPSEKGDDMKKYTKELKEVIKQSKEADTNFQKQVISEYLTKYNVKAKAKEFQPVLSQYETSADASSQAAQ